MDLTNLTLKELKVKLKKSLKLAEVYKDCQDGSYEAALHASAYYRINEEISTRTTTGVGINSKDHFYPMFFGMED